MQQEDDLRGLAKVMEFMRAISILFVLINIYWYCYEAFQQWNLTLETLNKILLGFQRAGGLFSSILWTKLFAIVFLALSCLGTKGVKEVKISWPKICVLLIIGSQLFLLNWWILSLPFPIQAKASLYISTLTMGYICLLMGGLYIEYFGAN